MKTKLLLFVLFFLLAAFANVNAQTDDLTKLKHFKIEVVTADDNIFVQLHKDMEIEPVAEKFTVVVNIKSDDKSKQFIYYSLNPDSNVITMNWVDISKPVQDALIAWSKPNKTPVADK